MDKVNGKTLLKQAFTIAEVLIVLVVIGALSIMMLSSLSKAMPDKNKTMFKKAYSVIEKSISELINDETLYPYNPELQGFRNNKQADVPGNELSTETNLVSPDCELTSIYKYKKTNERGCGNGHKFDVLFMDKLNIISVEAKDNCKDDNGSTFKGVCFTTSDGVGWMIQTVNFGSDSGDAPEKQIIIDTNGFKKGPNKHITEDNLEGDRFYIYVSFDGKITAKDEMEQKYMTEQSFQKED